MINEQDRQDRVEGQTYILRRLSNLRVMSRGKERPFEKTDRVWEIGRLSKHGGLEILGVFPYIVNVKKFRKREFSNGFPQHTEFLMRLLTKIYGPKTKVALTIVARADGFFPSKKSRKGFHLSTQYDAITQKKHSLVPTWRLTIWPIWKFKYTHFQYHEKFIHGHSLLNSPLVEHLVGWLGSDPDVFPDIMYVAPKKASLSSLLKNNRILLPWWTCWEGIAKYLKFAPKTEKSPKDTDILSLLDECRGIVVTYNRGFYLLMKHDHKISQTITRELDVMAAECGLVIPIDVKLTTGWDRAIHAFS